MTTLDQYYQTKQQLNAKMADGSFTVDKLLGYQELMYRISVLESCMGFVKTAPVSADLNAMCFHYQVVDEKLKNQRETARGNLETVVGSFRKQFQSFAPTSPEAYRDAVSRMINTVLPAWLQYRYTYIPF